MNLDIGEQTFGFSLGETVADLPMSENTVVHMGLWSPSHRRFENWTSLMPERTRNLSHLIPLGLSILTFRGTKKALCC